MENVGIGKFVNMAILVLPGLMPVEIVASANKAAGGWQLFAPSAERAGSDVVQEMKRRVKKFARETMDVAVFGTAFKIAAYVLMLAVFPLGSIAILGITLKAFVIADITLHVAATAYAVYTHYCVPKPEEVIAVN